MSAPVVSVVVLTVHVPLLSVQLPTLLLLVGEQVAPAARLAHTSTTPVGAPEHKVGDVHVSVAVNEHVWPVTQLAPDPASCELVFAFAGIVDVELVAVDPPLSGVNVALIV